MAIFSSGGVMRSGLGYERDRRQAEVRHAKKIYGPSLFARNPGRETGTQETRSLRMHDGVGFHVSYPFIITSR